MSRPGGTFNIRFHGLHSSRGCTRRAGVAWGGLSAARELQPERQVRLACGAARVLRGPARNFGGTDRVKGMTILVGYTPSTKGQAALTAAVDLAKKTGDKLYVVNAGVGEAVDEREVATEDQLNKAREYMKSEGVEGKVKQYLRGNDAAEELLALTEARSDVTMLVIGLRRRSPVGKLFMGSISQKIILNAKVPVLSVREAEEYEV